MQRWMANAAGGTIQRLKPGPAMVRSRERKLGAGSAAVDIFSEYLETCPSLANASEGRIPATSPGTVPVAMCIEDGAARHFAAVTKFSCSAASGVVIGSHNTGRDEGTFSC